MLFILAIIFSMFFFLKPKENTKASNQQLIEKRIWIIGNKPPVKNPNKTKPIPQPPPKNEPGGGGKKPSDPKDPPKGPDPDKPCPGCGPKSNTNCG